MTDRHAGLSVPLFASASTSGWGIGELPDIAPLARWVAACGGDRLMLLPLGTMAAGETSPYSACSAMAIDPIYIAVEAVPEFVRAGGTTALSAVARSHLEQARASTRVRYDDVRRVKEEALDAAFVRFVEHEWERHSVRASHLAGYVHREAWWLDDYALFQTLSDAHGGASWRDWPEALRDREPDALHAARRQHARSVLRHQYLQWIADGQWQAARRAAEICGVHVYGDLPFVVNLHSADVWARADEFLLDVSVGVPPDAFSETGQDWGLPAYRWDVVAARDFGWIRERARRMATLYSGFRIDHLIGFYRTYARPRHGPAFFSPGDEPSQTRQGETIVRIFAESGAHVIAEDLGTIPDFVRASLARLGVAGCKVLRWERQWHASGQPFIDPAEYAPVSCALTGTHDTDPLADWWDRAAVDERVAMLQLPAFADRIARDPHQPWSPALRDACLELAATAASRELFITVQDLFGWRDRVNVPGTVGDHNWTWRLPWPVDQLDAIADARARASWCRDLLARRKRR